MADAPDPTQLQAFLAAIRRHESGTPAGNYTITDPAGDAGGAYGFIPSTWSSVATEAGYANYANVMPWQAPPNIQDAVAAYMATQNYKQYGDWKDTAEAWYYPAWAGDPSKQGLIPAPGAGNTQTIGAMGDQIVQWMNEIIGSQAIATGQSVPPSQSSTSSTSQKPTGPQINLGGIGGIFQALDKFLNPPSANKLISMATLGAADIPSLIFMIVDRGILVLVFGAVTLIGFTKVAGSHNIQQVGKTVGEVLPLALA